MGAHRRPQQPIHQPFQVKPTVPYLAGVVLSTLAHSAFGAATPAAADACAEDEMVGNGGWAITSSQVVWFAETWNMQDIRAVWPCLVKPAQRYIACFETLAQLALLQATHSHIGGGHYSFSMPSSTDNSSLSPRPPNFNVALEFVSEAALWAWLVKD